MAVRLLPNSTAKGLRPGRPVDGAPTAGNLNHRHIVTVYNFGIGLHTGHPLICRVMVSAVHGADPACKQHHPPYPFTVLWRTQ